MGRVNLAPVSQVKIAFPKDKKITAYTIIEFLLEIHKRKGYVPKRNVRSYLREANKFIKRYGTDKTIELIIYACENCDLPYSFPYLEKIANETKKKKK